MSKWISVNDRLPDNGEWVLCHLREINGIGTGDTCYRTLQYDGSLEYFIVPVWIEPFEGGGYTIDRVTHWMPLPIPPVDTPATPTSITEVYDDETGELLAQYVDAPYGNIVIDNMALWMAMGKKLRFVRKTMEAK